MPFGGGGRRKGKWYGVKVMARSLVWIQIKRSPVRSHTSSFETLEKSLSISEPQPPHFGKLAYII